MLVLSRKKQETIRIGDDITITVIRIKGKSIRLGIDAPKGYSVLRGELEINAPETQEAPVGVKGFTRGKVDPSLSQIHGIASEMQSLSAQRSRIQVESLKPMETQS